LCRCTEGDNNNNNNPGSIPGGGVGDLAAELHAPLAAIHLAALRSRWSVFFPKPGTPAAAAAAALAARDPTAAATLAAAPRAILEHAGGMLSGTGALRAVLGEMERCWRQVNLLRAEVFVPLRPHFIAAALGAIVGRHHDSLIGELGELVHALASEDFQAFYQNILPGYVWSAAALPGLDDGQRGALLSLLPASAADEPSMKRGLGRLARDASLYLRANRAALE
jgi:hypothetical protein